MSEGDVSHAVAEITGWNYGYQFTGIGPEERLDIDIRLKLRKFDDTPLVARASLFAAGDTTPAGLVALGPGDYKVQLPIRQFQAIRWNPYELGGTTKRYLLNLKLTAIPEDEDDDPATYDFLGVSVGFRSVARLDPEGAPLEHLRINREMVTLDIRDWSAAGSETDLRAEIARLRDTGVNMLRVPSWAATGAEDDTLYRLCDELGMLVWQVIGEDTPPQLRHLQSHPCIVVWSEDREDREVPGVFHRDPGPEAIWL